MANSWFRVYSEFATDSKVQSMTEAMQRRLMMLLCLRCSNELVTLHDDEIAFALRITDAELAETKTLFIRKLFINADWEILNWDKRQFVSDSSAARVSRHRAKQKEAAKEDVKRDCNVTETHQIQNQNRADTESESESEQSRPKKGSKLPRGGEYPEEFEEAWAAYPTRSGANKRNAFKAWTASLKRGANPEAILAGVRAYAAYVQAKGTEDSYIKQPETFFGPGEHFLSDWTPKNRGSPDSFQARCDLENLKAKQMLFGKEIIDV